MQSTDERVLQLDFDAKNCAKRGVVPTYRCALIGSSCTKIHIVHVPVDGGCERDTRPEDLKYEFYLDVQGFVNSVSIDLDDFLVEYDQTPGRSMVSSYRWSIFNSTHAHPAVNTLIQTFYGADSLTGPVHGSYLVVKSDRHGHVKHITRDDFQIIREVLLDSLVTKQTLEAEAEVVG